jgi:hypothetical protein
MQAQPAFAEAKPQPQQPPAGEFTRMIQAQSLPKPPNPFPPPAAPPAEQAGEFTRMIQAHPVATAPVPQANPFPAGPSAGSPPGEFTRMIQAQPIPTKSPAPISAPPAPAGAGQLGTGSMGPVAPAGADQPSEFTRFFQAPIGPMPQSPAVQQPLTPQAPGTAGPNRVGEFTQIFGRGEIPQQTPVAPPLVAPGAANATQAFAVPVPPTAPAYAPAGYPGAGYQNPYAPGGYYNPYGQAAKPPSSYTQQFSAPAPLTLGQNPAGPVPMPAPAAAAPARSGFRKYLPLVVGLAAVLLLVAIVIFIFAARQK